jgi:hypothetical protein
LRLRNIVILAVILAVLVGVFYLVSRPEPTTPPKPIVYVWSIEMDDIAHITISLPREDLSQSFIKKPHGSDFPWFFDDLEQSPVDANRWGGGIPLLLSGPGADRIITEYATDETLTEYGLIPKPQMAITLTLSDNSTLKIDVGNKTPNGANFYLRAPGSNAVALVDVSWYEVLERLVKEPPYATKS